MTGKSWLLLYILAVNLVAFCLFGIDKWKAVHHRFRIPERILFGIAAVGGSFGARLGMSLFHHKTRHRSFTIGIPMIFLGQCVLVFTIYYFINKGIL